MSTDYDVIIVGGGIAGLRAALEIKQQTDNFLLLEKDDSVGGRVRTDNYNGFKLDRGFQVLLTHYPEFQDILDFSELNLKSFHSGSIIRSDDKFISMMDPLSHPTNGLQTLFNDIGTLQDRWLIMKLRAQLYTKSVSTILEETETTTEHFLNQYGFSGDIIENFFRPFLSGVFLESELRTSSRMFTFVYKMFSEGNTTIPANGMQEIPNQLVNQLPSNCVQTSKTVQEIESNEIHCADGDSYTARATIVATGGWELDQLDGLSRIAEWNKTSCLYYSLDEPPIDDPILCVNSNREETINNLCFPSLVSGTYSPPNTHLLSVSTLGLTQNSDERSQIESELIDWFGPQARDWTHLKTYNIRHALPEFIPSNRSEHSLQNMQAEKIYVCGDHRETPSLNGAMASGRKIASQALDDLGLR